MNFDITVVIETIAWLFIYIVFFSALLSFFLPPYHPVREALNRIVDPFLQPIRRLVPMVGALDFSPLVLMIAVFLLSRLLILILS